MMRAKEFVEQYGLDRAMALFRHIEKQIRIDTPDDFTIELSFCELSYADLKCFVKSQESVKKYGELNTIHYP